MISQVFRIQKFEGKKAVIQISPEGPDIEVEGIEFDKFVIFRSEQILFDDQLKTLLDVLEQTVPKDKRVLLLPKFIEVCEFVPTEEEAAPEVEAKAEAPTVGIETAEGVIGEEPNVIDETETDKPLDEENRSGTGEISEGGVQEAGSGDNQVPEKE